MKIRVKCTHSDQSWHYIYEEQTIINTNVLCPDHIGSTINEFVVVIEDTI